MQLRPTSKEGGLPSEPSRGPRVAIRARAQADRPVPAAPALGLSWLLRLRWIAGAFQLAVLFAATRFFAFSGTSGLLLALIALTLGTNLALTRLVHRGSGAAQGWIAGILLLDTVVLTAMLHLSGGPTNPFTVFYLVHVALAALLLDTRSALVLSLITSGCFAALFLFAGPGEHDHHGAEFSSHLQGMWIAYTLAACFIGWFVAKVARALQRRERELAKMQEVSARAERLASLSTLAAGAAHELGTPLGTIAVVARELERLCDRELDLAAIREDARLLRAEAERCRRIIDRMAVDAGESPGEAPRVAPLSQILQELEAELGPRTAGLVQLRTEGAGAVHAPLRSLVQALAILVRNGVDACEGLPLGDQPAVEVIALRRDGRISFEVRDRGRGITTEDLQRIGEPFFTTKAPGKGLGLGLFLVRALVERCDGSLEVESAPGDGASFFLDLPAA